MLLKNGCPKFYLSARINSSGKRRLNSQNFQNIYLSTKLIIIQKQNTRLRRDQ